VSRTSLSEFPAPLVADTSAVINLIATGLAPTILGALPDRLLVVDVVPDELENGRTRGRKDADRLRELVIAGLVQVVTLGGKANVYFEGLVVGPAAATLDDGEAATIAYALEHAGTALIDERKATRICADRFHTLRVCSTVELLTHSEMEAHLGLESLATAVFNALHDGRMGVLPDQLDRVVRMIGAERAALCGSLPKAVRPSTPALAEHRQ